MTKISDDGIVMMISMGCGLVLYFLMKIIISMGGK